MIIVLIPQPLDPTSCCTVAGSFRVWCFCRVAQFLHLLWENGYSIYLPFSILPTHLTKLSEPRHMHQFASNWRDRCTYGSSLTVLAAGQSHPTHKIRYNVNCSCPHYSILWENKADLSWRTLEWVVETLKTHQNDAVHVWIRYMAEGHLFVSSDVRAFVHFET